MICSICKCEADFTRYMCIAKDGHRWTWGYLCEECALHRKQTTLSEVGSTRVTRNRRAKGSAVVAEGACIPPPAPPPSKIEEPEPWGEYLIYQIRGYLEELEDYIIHLEVGESD